MSEFSDELKLGENWDIRLEVAAPTPEQTSLEKVQERIANSPLDKLLDDIGVSDPYANN